MQVTANTLESSYFFPVHEVHSICSTLKITHPLVGASSEHIPNVIKEVPIKELSKLRQLNLYTLKALNRTVIKCKVSFRPIIGFGTKESHKQSIIQLGGGLNYVSKMCGIVGNTGIYRCAVTLLV